MSAIAGLLRFDGQPAGFADGSGMMKAMEQYDADDVQTWTDGPVFLGCRSKWITPESVNERLPYYDPAYRLAIAADAIIDNRRELFDLLQVRPALRAGMTDSELILLAYRKWGREAPEHLVGDFAFVIWDEQERLLFGARDLFGNRCLYYHRDARRFAFGTTIAPLFALPDVVKELYEPWLAEFMAIPEMYESTTLAPRRTGIFIKCRRRIRLPSRTDESRSPLTARSSRRRCCGSNPIANTRRRSGTYSTKR